MAIKHQATRLLQHPATAWIVLVITLGITAIAWFIANAAMQSKAEERFHFQSQDISSAISERMLGYETALRSGASFFNAAGKVDRQAWRRYIADLRIQQNYPGIQGIGFSQIIPASKLEQHIATIRREGFPQYTVRPQEFATHSAQSFTSNLLTGAINGPSVSICIPNQFATER